MKTKALIVGGGIAGLTLANLIANAGLDCILVDKGAPLTQKDIIASGRTAALMNSSVNIIKAAGVWNDIEPIATPLKQMRLKDDGNPDIAVKEVNFAANDIGLEQFGLNIPNLSLQMALQKALKAKKQAKTPFESSLSHYKASPNGIIATLDNGETIEADIIIGCDGRSSKVRECAGIDISEQEYSQSGITCLISHSEPHNNVSTEHHRSGGPFTIVPMAGNQSSIVWVEKSDEAARLMALPADEFEQILQENTHGIVGTVKLETPPESWPLKTLIAKNLIAPRCAIAAETAHVMSPIGAQGLNLSLRDIAALAETLIDAARAGEDIGGDLVLKRYAQRRTIDISTRVEGIDKFNKIVSNNIGFLRGLRRSGLMALDAIPPLKRLIMHQGLAPSLDEGRLSRGEGL